jgi:hypothetical protein
VIGQDVLELEGESPIEVQIIEVGTKYISYKIWNETAPLYRANVNHISSIRYDNSKEILLQDNRPDFVKEYSIYKISGSNKFLVDGYLKKSFWDLGDYMATNPKAEPIFLKAVRNKRIAKNSFWSAIGLSITSGIFLSNSSGFNDSSEAAGLVTAFAAQILLYNAIGFKIGSLLKKRKAIAAYGIEYKSSSSIPSIQEFHYVHIGLTANGIGLVFNF